ncbi:MAG: LarC family nickel insertion protein [Firmicutes bacterium]|nr:LarC family nickel insertion protein [Bacillota bacterium]
MSTVLFWDPFSGISGDMAVGSLLSLGADWDAVQRAMAALEIPGLSVNRQVVRRGAVEATRFEVTWIAENPPQHRHLSQIRDILERAQFSPKVQRILRATFEALAEAEARIHGEDPEAVHLHEVGAEDSIADIVAAAVAFESLGVDRCVVGPIAVGSGWTEGAHGALPVPAPATLELLRGRRLTAGPANVELTTPTGAALLYGLGAASAEHMPPGTLVAIGYGAGARDLAHPNVLRALLLEIDDEAEGSHGWLHAL